MFAKAKKNDVIIIREAKSYHKINGKRVGYTNYVWAKAAKVDRKGRVETYVRVDGLTFMVDTKTFVCVISDPDRQAAARELFGTEPTKHVFPDAETIKAMILDRVEALR
jgi:hypothetical protein